MAIGIYVDFRNDKFVYLYKKLLQNNINLIFIGQKNYIESIKKKIGVKNTKYYVFNSIVSNNLNINQNSIFSYFINFYVVLKNYIYSQVILKSNNIKIILVSDDRSPDILLSLIKHSKKNKIKVILTPSGIFSGKRFVLQNRKKNLSKFASKKILSYNKKIFLKTKNNFIYFYKKTIIPSYNFFRLFPKNPWISGTNVDQVLFQSEVSKTYYLKQGLNNKIIKNFELKKDYKLIPKINFLKKNIFKKKYKITNDQKIIIFQPQTWHEHNITDLQEHLKRNKEVSDIIRESCNSKKITCLISLHPKQKIKNYLWMEKEYNFKILKERLFDIIHFSDLFILSYESDTMLWSVDLNIPCIVTNFHKEKSNVFNQNYLFFPKTRNDFKKKINQLIQKQNKNILDIKVYKVKQNIMLEYIKQIYLNSQNKSIK